MKVIVLGHKGTIGAPIVDLLQKTGHEVIKVSRSDGDYQLDYTDTKAIENFYQKVGNFDAVIVVVGGRDAYFGPIDSIGYDEFSIGFERKMMGQFNMVLIGKRYINPGGHFILTSGLLSDVPNSSSLVLGTVNAAVNSFVKHSSTMLSNDAKINAVSPGVVTNNPNVLQGSAQVYSPDLAKVYLKVLESKISGQTIKAWNLELNGILHKDLMDR